MAELVTTASMRGLIDPPADDACRGERPATIVRRHLGVRRQVAGRVRRDRPPSSPPRRDRRSRACDRKRFATALQNIDHGTTSRAEPNTTNRGSSASPTNSWTNETDRGCRCRQRAAPARNDCRGRTSELGQPDPVGSDARGRARIATVQGTRKLSVQAVVLDDPGVVRGEPEHDRDDPQVHAGDGPVDARATAYGGAWSGSVSLSQGRIGAASGSARCSCRRRRRRLRDSRWRPPFRHRCRPRDPGRSTSRRS